MTADSERGLIFISCGQATPRERVLGAKVSELITEAGALEPYFAQQQSTLEELAKNILGKLDKAVALIVIMHPRGKVVFDANAAVKEQIRGSVWIEQEIAIAAFITQVLRRPLRIAAFVHTDIALEGMREKLQINPITFTGDSEILEKLPAFLADWKGLPPTFKSLAPPKVRVDLSHGNVSNFLLNYANDEDEDVFIREVVIRADDVPITAPLRPSGPHAWGVAPHHAMKHGQTITDRQNPAVSLQNLYPNEGLRFRARISLSLTVEWRDHVYDLAPQTILVLVDLAHAQLVPLFSAI